MGRKFITWLTDLTSKANHRWLFKCSVQNEGGHLPSSPSSMTSLSVSELKLSSASCVNDTILNFRGMWMHTTDWWNINGLFLTSCSFWEADSDLKAVGFVTPSQKIESSVSSASLDSVLSAESTWEIQARVLKVIYTGQYEDRIFYLVLWPITTRTLTQNERENCQVMLDTLN